MRGRGVGRNRSGESGMRESETREKQRKRSGELKKSRNSEERWKKQNKEKKKVCDTEGEKRNFRRERY